MRKVMLSIIVMLAVLAGIPATACWYLDPTNPVMSALNSPPERVVPGVTTSETIINPETGAKTVTEFVDEGDRKYTYVKYTHIDPVTGVETTSYHNTFETYEDGRWKKRTCYSSYVFDPATGDTTVSVHDSNDTLGLYTYMDDNGAVRRCYTNSTDVRTKSKVVEGARYVDPFGGIPSSLGLYWETVEKTTTTVTETVVPVLDPETGDPVLDPETGEPMTESVYSDPISETTTVETGQTITLDHENGVIDSTNTTTTVVVINPSTGESETTTTTAETTTTTDPETGSTETTTETETQNPDGTTVTESGTKNETVTYDEYDAPIVNWWENRVRTEPYDIVTTNVTTSVDPVTGVTTITTTTVTEHWDGYGWNTTTDTQTQTIPPAPLLTKINHVPVRYITDPTTYSAPKTDAPMNVFVRARYYGDYTLHCFEANPSIDADGNPQWTYRWMPAKNTMKRVNGKYHSPQLMLFGRGLYPNLSRERSDIFWADYDVLVLSISTSADSLTAWREMMDCCGGVNCKFGRHKRIKLSNVAKPGK